MPPAAPNPQLFASLVGYAFTIAVVGFAIAISLGKIFALRHGYRVDSNQVWQWGTGVAECTVTPGAGSGGVWSIRWDVGRQQTDVLGPCGALRVGVQGIWGSSSQIRRLLSEDGSWGHLGLGIVA